VSEANLPELEDLVLQILRQHPEGLTEYALLRRLQQSRQGDFPAGLFKDNLTLFQAHFLLFHALYRLRDQLSESGQGWLEIDVLRIALAPPRGPSDARPLVHPDPLRGYYLDLENLRDTGARDVERMLGGFWRRYLANQRRAEALQALGLSDPVDPATIKQRYRRLAMRHHPDRGGDQERFRRLQAAMDVLEHCQTGV
jgi:hypothetical protein